MARIHLPTLAAMALAAVPQFASAAPVDVAEIAKVSESIESNADLTDDAAERALLGKYTRLVVVQATWIAESQGIGEVIKVRSPGFSAHVKKMLRPMVEDAAGIKSDVERKRKWYELLRNTSTESAGHRALASWMDFKNPGAYLSKVKRGDPPRVTTQVSAVSTDDRLVLVQDAITLAGEVGGSGEGNGIIDAGEWINLGLQVYNNDSRGFFSSSSWVETQAECAWVPPTLETEMAELPAAPPEEADEGKALTLKKKEKPTQPVTAWIYLSSACADGSIVPLQVRIKDTHRAPTAPIVLSAKMQVRNRTMGRAVDFLVDTDIPGVSDGRSMPAVEADRVFELTHGFAAPEEGLMSARTGWGVHEDVGSVIAQQQAASEPMLAERNGRFLPGDDLDLSTIESDDFDKTLQSRADEDRWDSVDDARAWFAADTEVLYETPDPPTVVVEEPPDEVCDNYLDDDGDGRHDCDDSDCKTEKVCNPSAPVGLDPLMKLIKQNVDLVANPASPTVPGAVRAVEPGYELVIDSSAIATQYACLVEGIPAKQCGECADFDLSLEACKTCIAEGTELRMCGIDTDCEEEKKEAPVEIDTGRDPTVAYNYRNYFTMPLAWNPIESEEFGNCDDDWDNDLDGNTDQADPDCGEPVEICGNGLDDDGNGKTDHEDPECRTAEVCDDGIDNDQDGAVDLEDSQCQNPEGLRYGNCSDGIDNDQDGKTDLQDEGCQEKDPFGHRVDLGVLLGQVTFTDRDTVQWSSPGGPIPMLNLRYVLTPRSGGPIRPVVSYAFSRAYDIVHGKTDTVSFSSYGGGLLYHYDINSALAVEARGLVNNRTFVIAPDSAGDEDLLSATTTNVGAEVGVEAHYAFDFGLGIYAGVGAVFHGGVQAEGQEILGTGVPVVTAGVNWNVGN